jgi:hypothetical protein
VVPKPPQVGKQYGDAARIWLHRRGLVHLRASTRHPHVVIDKGTDDDPWPCARLRRDTVHLWILEIADGHGRWCPTGMRGLMDDLLAVLVDQFGWIVAPVP